MEQALGEKKSNQGDSEQKWSDAVRTKAAVNLTPQQALVRESLSPVAAAQSPETYSSIRPLSHALTNKEIEMQQKRLVCPARMPSIMRADPLRRAQSFERQLRPSPVTSYLVFRFSFIASL